MTSNVKVLVCCHKKDMVASMEPYMPLHVGKAISDLDLGMAGDDTGENISRKNPLYCEMTGIYWAWKNLKNVDIIGLCHYRRYFDFHHKIRRGLDSQAFPAADFAATDFSIPESVLEKVRRGAIVAAKEKYLDTANYYQYSANHYSEDLRALMSVVEELSGPEMSENFRRFLRLSNELSPYNMFLMRWEDFDEYCSWVFPILEEMERRVKLENYPAYQKRIFGFMAERLFNVFLYTRNGRGVVPAGSGLGGLREVLQYPVIWFDDKAAEAERDYWVRIKNRIAFWLSFAFIRLTRQ